jgi:hypothetical protein
MDTAFFILFFKKKVARAGERTRDLLISFIFSFHHFTAEPQRLPTFMDTALVATHAQSDT